MKVRNILSNRKTGKRLAGEAISDVLSNRADDLNLFVARSKKHRTSGNSVNSDAINQISTLRRLPSANFTREKTECLGADTWVTKPSDFNPRP